MIRKAAQGLAPDRADFARMYEPVARVYFIARWKGTAYFNDVDDAVQDAFIECFKEQGALGRADAGRPGGFRAFFYGVRRNVALMAERKRARRHETSHGLSSSGDGVPADETGLSSAFDRALVESILKEAVERHRERAEESDPAALRRWEFLRLRFSEDLPVREIAERWGEDPKHLHDQQRQAKKEFQDALFEVVQFHHPASTDVAGECRAILDLLR